MYLDLFPTQSLVSSFSVSFDINLMPNPSALYEDLKKLNALYEELCWGYDDELVFTHDGEEVIIYNKTKQEKNNGI